MDRPRILLSPSVGTSVETYRARCTTDPDYMGRCQGSFTRSGGEWEAVRHAARFVVNDDPTGCDDAYARAQVAAADAPGSPDAHSFISSNQRTMAELTITLDWCWDALEPTERDWLIDRAVTYADWYLGNSPPDVALSLACHGSIWALY